MGVRDPHPWGHPCLSGSTLVGKLSWRSNSRTPIWDVIPYDVLPETDKNQKNPKGAWGKPKHRVTHRIVSEFTLTKEMIGAESVGAREGRCVRNSSRIKITVVGGQRVQEMTLSGSERGQPGWL